MKLQSYFIWNSPTYSVELHSAKACTLCKTEVTFIQASGSCWWPRDVFFCRPMSTAEPVGDSTWPLTADTGISNTFFFFFEGKKQKEKRICNMFIQVQNFISLVRCFSISNDPVVEVSKGWSDWHIWFVTMPEEFRKMTHNWQNHNIVCKTLHEKTEIRLLLCPWFVPIKQRSPIL